ncbi:hypothetical protein SDC9_200053 [bioreactor metagenome]|uniref:Uncharacterized protein n=1 Tax=bioreactor metagenome TaxID=1076179 RepID=A0A645INF6_9ZZZZ
MSLGAAGIAQGFRQGILAGVGVGELVVLPAECGDHFRRASHDPYGLAPPFDRLQSAGRDVRQVDFDRRARCSCPFTGRKTRDEGDGGRRGRNTAGRSRGDQPCAALRIHGAGRRKGKVAHVGLLVRG